MTPKGLQFRFALLTVSVLIWVSHVAGQTADVRRVKANGAEFHYIDKGTGETVVMLHGGIGDLRSWDPQIEEFAKTFRVISYSRRFHHPNQNRGPRKTYSVYTEAEDLYAFLNALDTKDVHLVGTSIGAFVALVFAIEHPGMVRSLVLGEPPVHQLIRSEPRGERIYKDFVNSLSPVRDAFNRGDNRGAMIMFARSMGRDFERLPPEVAEQQMQNAAGLRANVSAKDPFPAISESTLRRLTVPAFIITGENTVVIHKLVDEKLARLVPNSDQLVVRKAGHAPSRENPAEYNEAVLKFLGDASKKRK